MVRMRRRVLWSGILGGLVVASAFGPGCSCGDEEIAPVAPTGGSGGSGGQGGGGGTGGAADGLFIDGLSAPVSVVYDEYGIPHITGQTDEDCIAALGYIHAANRFFVMDFVRHAMRGQLAGLVEGGDLVLASDYYYRQFFSTASGEPLEEALVSSLSPEMSAALERYAAGVNAWIGDVEAGRNGAKLSVEYEFPLLSVDTIRPWEPEDTIAMGMYMMDALGNTIDDELTIAAVTASLSPELAADLLMTRPIFDDFTVAAAGETFATATAAPKGADLTALQQRLSPQRQLFSRLHNRMKRAAATVTPRPNREAVGSNNWLVAPERTAEGFPLLANDPHLGMNNPAIFLLAEIDAKSGGTGTLHTAGGTIPAIPSVLTGHNEDIAWGVTTAYYDLNEVYVETLSDDGKDVWFEGAWVPLIEKELTFANAAGDPVTKSFKWVPHHGPLMEEDAAAHTGLSVRWVLQEGSLPDLASFIGLNRASSTAEAATALEGLTVTDQNFIVVDRDGNVGWYPMGTVPNRPWASAAMPSWAPVPGDGSAEWDGFIDLADLPRLDNPTNGIIATANQDITGDSADGDLFNDGHPPLQALDTAPGARMHRIVELLEDGGDAHTVDTLLAIQSDTHSSLGELLVPPLLAELDTLGLTGPALEVRDALAAWQYTCPSGLSSTDPAGPKDDDPTRAAEAVGCTVFHTVLFRTLVHALADEELVVFGEDAVSNGDGFLRRGKVHLLLTELTSPGTLQSGGAFWDDVSTVPVETRADILNAAMTESAALLAGVGPDPDDWRWGRVHTVTFASIFQEFGIPTYNNGPFVNDGGLWTVDVAIGTGDGVDARGLLAFPQDHGATARTVIQATPDGLHMKIQQSGGTTLDRDSPFYDQFVDGYLRNEPVDFPFGPGAVTNPAIELTIEPTP
jgi:penicillin amidase